MAFSKLQGRHFRNPLLSTSTLASTSTDELRLSADTGQFLASNWKLPFRRKSLEETFTYSMLHFIEGIVTFCRLGDGPVITGPMSGCYLFAFRQGVHRLVAHVGSSDNDLAKSAAAKRVWAAHAARDDVTEVLGFNPARDIGAKTLTGFQKSGLAVDLVGFWDPDGTAYLGALALGKLKDDPVTLVHVQKAKPRPWDVIKAEDVGFASGAAASPTLTSAAE
ncbi:MAG: hypothetical protein AAFY65_14200 [Pseudomonadota bacterium]